MVKWKWSLSAMSDSLRPCGLWPTRLPPFMGLSRQEYWSGLPFPSPGDLPNPGIEPGSPVFQEDALTSEPRGKPVTFCHKSGVICISEVIDISPNNLDSSLCPSSPAFLMMYSAYKLNKQDDNIQPWRTPFPIWTQSVVPCPVLTVASWPAYRFLRRWVRWYSHLFKNFPQFFVIHAVKVFCVLSKRVDGFFVRVFVFLSVCLFSEFPCLSPWSSDCWQFDLWFLCLFYNQLEHQGVQSSCIAEAWLGEFWALLY